MKTIMNVGMGERTTCQYCGTEMAVEFEAYHNNATLYVYCPYCKLEYRIDIAQYLKDGLISFKILVDKI